MVLTFSKDCHSPLQCHAWHGISCLLDKQIYHTCRDPPQSPRGTPPLSGSTLSVPPSQGGHVACQLYPGPSGGHTTLSNIIPGWCYILSGYIVRIIDRKKQAMLSHPKQPVIAHVPPPVERKDKSDGKSPPMISNSRLGGDDDSAITSRTSWQAKKSSHH